MRTRTLLLVGLLLIPTGVGAWVLLPRSHPQFAWLVFGPEAKLRIQVRLDGQAISLGRYEDGEAPQQIAHFDRLESCKNVLIPTKQPGTTYRLVNVVDIGVAPPDKLLEFVAEIRSPTGDYRQAGWLGMVSDPAQAVTGHFDGPLTVSAVDKKIEPPNVRWETPAGLVLRRGDKPTNLFVNVGTTNERNTCRIMVGTADPLSNQALLPPDLHPFADIEFPAKDANHPALRQRYALAAVC